MKLPPAGPELDRLVAEKVFGKIYPEVCRLVGSGTMDDPLVLDYPEAIWRERSPADRFWERWSPDGAERVRNISCPLPAYSTCIEDAWQVVERGTGECPGSDPLLEGRVLVQDWDGSWIIRTLGKNGLIDWNEPELSRGKTAPEAICRAALRAQEGE